MIYYLITNKDQSITISFEEPNDSRIRCYGFNNWESIPTKYSSNRSSSFMDCGDELKEIISSYYLNGILPWQGKNEGDLIKPLDFNNEKEMFNLIIDKLKNNDEEIKLIVNYYSSSSYPYVKQSDHFNKIISYLMTMFKSDAFRGTVLFANKKYNKSGENCYNLNFFDLKNELIYEILDYCVKEGIYIEFLETILSYKEISTFEDFCYNIELFNSRKNYDIPEELFMMLSKRFKFDSKESLDSFINSYIKSNDEAKLEIIRSCSENINYFQELTMLYDNNYKPLISYAKDMFKLIDNSKIYLNGDCQYYTAVLINQKLANKFSNDELLTLSFHKGFINRGPSIMEEDSDKLICYINTAHGDDFCKEMFLKYAERNCNSIVPSYDSTESIEEINNCLNIKIKLEKEFKSLGFNSIYDFLINYNSSIHKDIFNKYKDELKLAIFEYCFSYDLKKLAIEKELFLEDFLNSKDPCTRILLVEKGFYLDQLLNDEEAFIRETIAEKGYRLDKLVNDKDFSVRMAVAQQGYGLDKLVGDENFDVRINVDVWLEKHNMTLEEWKVRYPEKCVL